MRRALLVAGVALLAACPGATTKPVPADRLAAVPETDRPLRKYWRRVCSSGGRVISGPSSA